MAKSSSKGSKKKSAGKAAVEDQAVVSRMKSPENAEADGLQRILRHAEPLDATRHGDLRVTAGRDFSFARSLHTVPLSAVEFMPSARHYPIIFAGESVIQPVALLGLRSDENLFVEEDGRWKEGCYVPAILRRAPFVLMQDTRQGRDGVGLWLDVDSPLISKTEGTPIFNEGKPTALLAKMANFAASVSREQARTRTFVNACLKHDLLVEKRMEITLASGQKIIFSGFRVIDEERLRNLDDAAALQWFRSGWCALAIAHFLSLGNMGRLHHRSNRRVTTGG